MIAIHAQPDFRKYLERMFLEEKASTPGVTLATYAKRFGMAGSSLKMVLSGERNLTLTKLHEIARALRMPPAQTEFFEALVLHDQADSPETRSYYKQRLKKLRSSTQVRQLGTSDTSLVSDWLLPPLLIHLIDIERVRSEEDLANLDVATLAAKFGVEGARMRRLLDTLRRTGLLKFAPEGQAHIVFERVTRQLPEKTYLVEISRELGLRIERGLNDPRTLFRAFTLSCDRAALADLRSELVELMERFMAKPATTSATIHQFLVGAFPVT